MYFCLFSYKIQRFLLDAGLRGLKGGYLRNVYRDIAISHPRFLDFLTLVSSVSSLIRKRLSIAQI